MDIIPEGVPYTISETYGQAGLFIGVQIYNDNGSTPVAIGGVRPMLNYDGASYRLHFSGSTGISYLAKIKAYTDDTYATQDTDEPEADTSFTFASFSGGGGGGGATNVGEISATVFDNIIDVRLD